MESKAEPAEQLTFRTGESEATEYCHQCERPKKRGQELRLRRVKLQQRKETSSLLQNSLLGDSSTLQKSPVKNSGRLMVSVASSPIIFPKVEDQAIVCVIAEVRLSDYTLR
ncbi:hypothetical protein KIN20_015388 [Parelaphostrongylus tenuis]|uniref:Uncharacterized protein n=1 Tax=Parelaphostrongylus tenuis TaxID=148309 RepID=A0AAD5MET7_PARTN|nr:hypothetical protein KIN20_015388 [Parelaphostrongylus tenuis]